MTSTLDEALTEIATLQEAISDLQQLAMEDRGWDRLIGQANEDLTAEGRRRISSQCEVMSIANPLIKRGFMLRHSYIWGAGCEVTVKPGESDKQGRIPEIIDGLWSDDRNRDSLASEAAREALERWLYTNGAVVLLLDTDPDTGDVVVRQEDPSRVTDRICDPEDSTKVWYWQRQYTTRPIRKNGTPGAAKTVNVWHPDVDYTPPSAERPDMIGRSEVRWDQPLLVAAVNRPASTTEVWGFGDAYAALPWARMSSEFLQAWFTLMKALARFAWQTKTGGNAGKMAARARAAAATGENPTAAGAHVFTDAATQLEAVPKTGATIDATSGQPLQQMVAAALDVPVTMLLGDPGTSGARAVAETLDQPMELAMGARRRFWSEILGRLAWHRLTAVIEAGASGIPGVSVEIRDGRRTVRLPEGWDPIITTEWPDFDSVPVADLMSALRDADGLDVLPPELVARLAMAALGVKDPEAWLETMRDDQGNLLPPSAVLDRALAESHRR